MSETFFNPKSDPHSPIIIIGAGPAGLATAVTLTKHLLSCKVFDKALTKSDATKATGLHPETTEFLIKCGGKDNILENGHLLLGNKMYADQQLAAEEIFDNGPDLLTGNISLEQSITERILENHLNSLGVQVERGVELQNVAADAAGASLLLKRGQQQWQHRTDLVVGADGINSTTRTSLNIDCPGSTSEALSFALDCEVYGRDLSHDCCHRFFRVGETMTLVPMRGERHFKLTGKLPPDITRETPQAELITAIQELADYRGGIEIVPRAGRKASVYRISNQIAETFVRPGAALVGDAAHVFLQIGGNGLNTAIGDGILIGNLLSALPKEQALEKYNAQRMAYAHQVKAEVMSRKDQWHYRSLRQHLDKKLGVTSIAERKYKPG